MSPRISVVTATYQRGTTLPRLYESLLGQSYGDFEWIVVDDGSSDGTEDLVRGWEGEAPFRIGYRWQSNQGKHVAFNRCVELAQGEFCALIDSDDWYTDQALEEMLECWDSIPVESRGQFANVEGLRVDVHGDPVGDRFPADVFDSNAFELGAVHGVRGDTVGMYRRDVLLEYPFPENLAWHVTPALVWNRIAARYSSRFVNKIWSYTGYEEGGLTARQGELRLRFPEAQLLYWTEFAAMPRPMSIAARARAHVNCVRYALLTAVSPRSLFSGSQAPGWTLAAAPLGSLLYLRDRRRLRGVSREAP